MTRIMENGEDEDTGPDDKSNLTVREVRKTRKHTMSASEVHPIPTMIDIVESRSRDRGNDISEEIRSFKLREIQRLEDEAEMAQLQMLAAQRKKELNDYLIQNKTQSPELVQQTSFEPQSNNAKSYLSDPDVVRAVANMPSEKQAAFFQSIAQAEIAEKNPQMAMFNTLLNTYQRMTPQQAQQADPLDVVVKVTQLQKTLRESDPMYQQMQRYAQEQSQGYNRQGPQTDPNSLTGILEKKIADKIANASIDELFGGAKPTQQTQLAAGGAIDAGTGLFLDEETGMYIPKHVNYEQYLDINNRREQRLSSIEESESKERQMKMLTDNVVTPLIARAQPLIDAVINKASTAIVNPTPPLQSQAAPATTTRPIIPPGVPAPPGPPPETLTAQPENFECMNCHNQWIVYPDVRGRFPSMIKCKECGAIYNMDAPQSGPPGAPPAKSDRPGHDESPADT